MLIEFKARQGLFGVQKNKSNIIEKKTVKNCQRLLDTNLLSPLLDTLLSKCYDIFVCLFTLENTQYTAQNMRRNEDIYANQNS